MNKDHEDLKSKVDSYIPFLKEKQADLEKLVLEIQTKKLQLF
jgi:hypothetical protein